jgi:CubicO group peptidase (beta-lactamase class C family)
VRSTAADLLELVDVALASTDEDVAAMFRLAIAPRARISGRMSIGLGWLITHVPGKTDLVWHGGGTWGFRSVLGYAPETGGGVVVLTNTFRGVDRLGLQLFDAMG